MKYFFSVLTIAVFTFSNATQARGQTTSPPPIELSEPPPALPSLPRPGGEVAPERSHDDHAHDGHSHKARLGPHGGRIVEFEEGVAVELVYDPWSKSVTIYFLEERLRPCTLRDHAAHCDGAACGLNPRDRTHRSLFSYHEPYFMSFGTHCRSPICRFNRFEPEGHFHP